MMSLWGAGLLEMGFKDCWMMRRNLEDPRVLYTFGSTAMAFTEFEGMEHQHTIVKSGTREGRHGQIQLKAHQPACVGDTDSKMNGILDCGRTWTVLTRYVHEHCSFQSWGRCNVGLLCGIIEGEGSAHAAQKIPQ